VQFEVLPTRLTFLAHDPVCLPPGKETNVFRGAFGLALREVSCDSQCPGAHACLRAANCAYARLFEPRWEQGPSGYRNAPRPFVLRWRPTDLTAGTTFSASLNLFVVERAPLPELAAALRVLAARGIGPGRAKAEFHSLKPESILRLPLQGPEANGRVTIRFATPTELKQAGEVSSQPEFGVLLARLVERIWTLGRLYQGWATWDYRDLLERSRIVRLVDWQWHYWNLRRRSSRTGQHHSVGGFTGTATYEGPIGIFLPLLEIGRWIGVGRQTVWGKGEILVENVELA
jgi:hypothetical protein